MKNYSKKNLLSEKIVSNLYLSVWLWGLLFITSCGNSPQVTPANLFITTFCKTTNGTDLLKPEVPTSYKQQDLKTVTKMDSNGTIKEIDYYDGKGIQVYFDGFSGYYYFYLSVPTNAYQNPIETLVTLAPDDTDTVTYTFAKSRYPHLPDKIYYNKKLVWDIADAPRDGDWQPITVIK